MKARRGATGLAAMMIGALALTMSPSSAGAASNIIDDALKIMLTACKKVANPKERDDCVSNAHNKNARGMKAEHKPAGVGKGMKGKSATSANGGGGKGKRGGGGKGRK